jgi:diguanylate cyclase (GGDEF)-like protein/PAS domain S-box-containing protein
MGMDMSGQGYFEMGNETRERLLAEARQWYQSLFESYPEPVILFNLDGHITSANTAASLIYGFQLEELLGIHFLCLSAPEEQEASSYKFDLVVSGKAQQYEGIVIRKDGMKRFFDFTVIPVCIEGEIVGVCSIGRDITKRKEAEQALAESEERFKLLAQTTNDVVWDWNILSGVFHWNEGIYTVLGYEGHEVPSDFTQWLLHIHPDDRHRVEEGLSRIVHGSGGYWTDDYRYLKGDGSYAYIHNRGSIIRAEDGVPLRMIGALMDMTPIKCTEERLMQLAQNDSLTGLANRTLFYDHLQLAISRAVRNGKQVALMFLDLDRFKEVNDKLGHDTGDAVLVEVARRLKECLRDTDLVSRLGGDEFTVIIEDVMEIDAVAGVAEKIVEIIARPITVTNQKICVSASIGISLYPNDADRIEDLVKQSDCSMYHAKRMGRNNFQFYDQTLNARASENVEMEAQLIKSIELNELELYYQPQVDLKTRQIIGVEALLRWNSPVLGFLLPDRFIPLAEKTGMILPIGEWVIRTACLQQKRWQDLGLPALRISVNLSARQLNQDGFVDILSQILTDTGFERACLELEIAEAALIEDREESRTMFEQLKQLGISLSIDGFGSGYSSLRYLMTYPLDSLKLDHTFVRRLPDNVIEVAVATAIIRMAHDIGLKVVAEGIETAQQLYFLTSRSCDYGQGFLFSKPKAAARIATYIQDGN